MNGQSEIKKVSNIDYDVLIKKIETDGFLVIKSIFTRNEIEK